VARRSARILLVDDEADVREVLREYLDGQGFDVETAEDGERALAAARRARPDLILLDVRMPGLDGVQTLRRLRELDASVPVVMVTANDDVSLARETLRLGAIDYVAKPFDFAYLDRCVAAGLLQAEGAPPGRAEDDDAFRRLARTVFRAVRGMPERARGAIGARLESTALAVVRAAATGRPDATAPALAELDLLVSIASELGDLAGSELAAVVTATADARRPSAAR